MTLWNLESDIMKMVQKKVVRMPEVDEKDLVKVNLGFNLEKPMAKNKLRRLIEVDEVKDEDLFIIQKGMPIEMGIALALGIILITIVLIRGI